MSLVKLLFHLLLTVFSILITNTSFVIMHIVFLYCVNKIVFLRTIVSLLFYHQNENYEVEYFHTNWIIVSFWSLWTKCMQTLMLYFYRLAQLFVFYVLLSLCMTSATFLFCTSRLSSYTISNLSVTSIKRFRFFIISHMPYSYLKKRLVFFKYISSCH